MAPLTRSQRRAAVAVGVVALALRVAWCVRAAREPIVLADPALYRGLAHQLARFDGYVYDGRPTAYYPIGYPAVLGVLFGAGRLVGLDGDSAETFLTVLLNLVAGMAAVGLVFVLARRIAGAWAAIAAAAVVAVMPNLVFHTATTLSETLFIALVLVAAVLLAPTATTRRLVAAGAVLGLAALVRPIVLPVLPLLLLVWWSAGVAWRRAARDVALVTVAAVVVIVPWTVRNALRMDSFVPISTNTGDNLCMSRQPEANGGFVINDHCFGGPALEGLERPEYEIERDAQGRRLALEFVRERPARELRLWLSRMAEAFKDDHDALRAVEDYEERPFLGDGERDLYRRVADAAWYLLGPLGLAAAVAVVAVGRLRRDPKLVLVVVFAVGMLLPIVLFFGDPRFKVPVVPFLAVLVATVPSRLRVRPSATA